MDPHYVSPTAANANVDGVTRVDSSRNSVQTIDASSNHQASAFQDVPEGGEPKPSYLDHYVQLDREEKAKSKVTNANRSPKNGEVEANADEMAYSATNRDDDGPTSPGGAGGTTTAVEVEKRVIDVNRPRELQLAYTDEEMARGAQQFFDIPDPTFYLGAALLIGCVCLFTWMASFILEHGNIRSMYVWVISGGAAFVFLLGPLIYYAVTSKHYHWCGRLWDGLCGSLPCSLAAFGVVFVYAFGIETIINTVHDGDKRAQFLIYGTIPLFLLVFLPVFFAMIKFQDKVSKEIRARDPLFVKEHKYDQQPITSSGFIYMGVMFRRVIVGWVCGVCLAAHVTLPAYGLSWLAYGLYTLQLEEGIWVIFVIVIPPIIIITVLAIIKKTRFLPLILWHICVQWFYYPLMNWDPREGGFWYRYDNGVTYERMVNQHNAEVSWGERAYLRRQDAESQNYYNKANETRKLLNQKGVHYAEIDATTGDPIPGSGNSGDNAPDITSPTSPLAPTSPAAPIAPGESP